MANANPLSVLPTSICMVQNTLQGQGKCMMQPVMEVLLVAWHTAEPSNVLCTTQLEEGNVVLPHMGDGDEGMKSMLEMI